jgi:hypothetical protein
MNEVDPTICLLLEEIAAERSRKRRLELLLNDVIAEKEDLKKEIGPLSSALVPATSSPNKAGPVQPFLVSPANPQPPSASITTEYEYKIVTKRQRLSYNPSLSEPTRLPPLPNVKAESSAPMPPIPSLAQAQLQPIGLGPTQQASISPGTSLTKPSGTKTQSTPAIVSITAQEAPSSSTTNEDRLVPEETGGALTKQIAAAQANTPITLPPPISSIVGPGSFSIGNPFGSFGSFSQLFDVRRNSSCSADNAALIAAAAAVANGSLSGRKSSIGRGLHLNGRFSFDWSQWTDDQQLGETLTDFFDF